MLEPVGAIKSKTIAGPEKIHNSNALTTEQNSDNIVKTQERLHLAKNKNISKAKKISQDKIDHIAKAMENFIRSTDKDLKIKIHNETGQIIIKVISGADGKVIREFPSEELLNLAAKVEEMTGVLFNTST